MLTDIIIHGKTYPGIDPDLSECIREIYEAATDLRADFEKLVDKIREVRIKEVTAREHPTKYTREEACKSRQQLYSMVYRNEQIELFKRRA